MFPDILLIRPGAIGDTLMLLPALAGLSGQALVSLVGRQPGLGFLQDRVYRALDFEGAGWHRLFMKKPDGMPLPVSSADVVVGFLTDADGSVGRNLEFHFPRIPRFVFPSLPPKGVSMHVARYLCDCLVRAGLPINVDKSMEAASHKGLLGGSEPLTKKNWILVHPGSGDPKKNHPPEFWFEVFTRLCDREIPRGFKCGLLLGPAEERLRAYLQGKIQSTKGMMHFCPEKEELTGLLKEAAVYLGHDSGVTHLAALLGIPTVALFKGSDVLRWRPLGPKVQVMEGEADSPLLLEKLLEASRSILSGSE